MNLKTRSRGGAARRNLGAHIDDTLSADAFQRRERTCELRTDDGISPFEAITICFGGMLQPALPDRRPQSICSRDERLHLLVEGSDSSPLSGNVCTCSAEVATMLTVRAHRLPQALTKVVALVLDRREQAAQPPDLRTAGFKDRRGRSLQVGILGLGRPQDAIAELHEIHLELVAQPVGFGAQPYDLLGGLLRELSEACLRIGGPQDDALELLELGEVNVVGRSVEVGRPWAVDVTIRIDTGELCSHDRREPRWTIGIDAGCLHGLLPLRESDPVALDLLHPHWNQLSGRNTAFDVALPDSIRSLEPKVPLDPRQQFDDGGVLTHPTDASEKTRTDAVRLREPRPRIGLERKHAAHMRAVLAYARVHDDTDGLRRSQNLRHREVVTRDLIAVHPHRHAIDQPKRCSVRANRHDKRRHLSGGLTHELHNPVDVFTATFIGKENQATAALSRVRTRERGEARRPDTDRVTVQVEPGRKSSLELPCRFTGPHRDDLDAVPESLPQAFDVQQRGDPVTLQRHADDEVHTTWIKDASRQVLPRSTCGKWFGHQASIGQQVSCDFGNYLVEYAPWPHDEHRSRTDA